MSQPDFYGKKELEEAMDWHMLKYDLVARFVLMGVYAFCGSYLIFENTDYGVGGLASILWLCMVVLLFSL